MSLYDYKCWKCGKTQEAHRSIAERYNGPECCGAPTEKQVSHYHVAPMFNAYRAVGHERGRVIKNRDEHRDYLKRYGYEEVGNDPSYAPPPHDPDRDAAAAREMRESLGDMKHADEAAV
jgi:putative FmdB family regulatory protein